MFLRLSLFFLSVFSIFLLPHIPQVDFWDQAVVAFFALHRTPFLTRSFLFITDVGSTWGFLAALLIPFLIYLRRKSFSTAFSYLVGVGFLKASVSGWKYLVARPRPADAMMSLNSYSMPSGHASNAVIIYGMLLIYLFRRLKTGWGRGLAILFCFGMIFATDLSRVYLGVHYPSDVLMGSLYTATGLWILQGLKGDVFSF